MQELYTADQLSNDEYHNYKGFYSSSQLKDAAEDIELFHQKYITGEVVQESIPAFDVGTYIHTAILEPEKLEEECAVFTGKIRRGKEWDAFKAANKGKAIITGKEHTTAQNAIAGVERSPISRDLLSGGSPEVSCFTELEGLDVKVRADYINFEKGYIVDIKSTTGNSRNLFKTQKKITDYDYHLSAALYLDAFNSYCRAKGMPPIRDFYWVFCSKDHANAKAYRADGNLLQVGRAKYLRAISEITKYEALDWEFIDELGCIGPQQWEADLWLKGEGKDPRKHETRKPLIRQSEAFELL